MTDEPPSNPPLKFSKATVRDAVSFAERSVTREAMRLPNPHDLNNIRTQIRGATAKIVKMGAEGFHERMNLIMSISDLTPLVLRGHAIIARRLGIELTPQELEAVSKANSSVIWAKAAAPQQDEDIWVDMIALKKEVTPRYNRPGEVSTSLRTTHNKEDYYARLLAKGYSEDRAYRAVEQYSLAISRIGQSLARFNPNYNNCVDFFNMAVERVLAHAIRKNPNTPEILLDYVREWRDEVKRDFMCVDVKETMRVKKVMEDVAASILRPNDINEHVGRQTWQDEPPLDASALNQAEKEEALERQHINRLTEARIRNRVSVSRHHRNLIGDEQPSRKILSDEYYHHVAALFPALSQNFSERHDPDKVALYLELFLNSAAYKETLEKVDAKTRRVIGQAMEEIHARLNVPYLNDKLGQENLNQSFRDSQRHMPHATGYLNHTAAIETRRLATKDKPNGIA